MEACLDHAITYLGQTACDGVVFGPQQDAMLVGYSDSDWHVSHSTSAHVLMYGDACVCYGSRRQHCIAMSSTEAEGGGYWSVTPLAQYSCTGVQA